MYNSAVDSPMKLVAIAIFLILLGGCTARESDDIVKLRLTQEFAKDERTFHECADWARESLGEDASGAEQMELTNSCLHMQTDLQDREADIKEKEDELETAKRELEEARQKIEDARRKREAERERELEETKRKLEEERRKREAAEKERAQANIPQSAPVIVMTVTPSPKADGQSKDNLSVDRQWTILNNEAWALLNQGKHEDALPAAKKALAFAEQYKGRNHLDTASSLVQLAYMHFYTGEDASAVPLLRRALAIQEAELGPNHRDVGDTLARLARSHTNQVSKSKFKNEDEFFAALSPAVSWYSRALAIKEAILYADNPELAPTLHNFAYLYTRLKKYELAEELYCRALNLRERVFEARNWDEEWDWYKEDSRGLNSTRHMLANLYEDMGEKDRAAALLKARVVYNVSHAFRISFSPRPGSDEWVKRILGNWGELPCAGEEWKMLNAKVGRLIGLDEYDKALPSAKKALALAEKQMGENHPDLALSLGNLALVYHKQGDYSSASPLYYRALRISEFNEHKERVKILRNKLEQIALPLAKERLRLAEQQKGRNHTHTAFALRNLAKVHVKQGDYSSAVPLFRRAMAIYEAAHGKVHLKVAQISDNLANAYEQQGDHSSAIPLLRHALPIYEAEYGKESLLVAEKLRRLAVAYVEKSDDSSAVPLLRRVLVTEETGYGKVHLKVADTLFKLANVHVRQGDYSLAVPLYRRALAIQEAKHDKDNPEVGRTVNNLAYAYFKQGEYSSASLLFHRALTIYEAEYGKAHPNTERIRSSLAVTYDEMGEADKAAAVRAGKVPPP